MSWKDTPITDNALNLAYKAEQSNKFVISTPYKVACEMVELLPEELFVPKTKFLNIFSKSGQILFAVRNRLMESEALIKRFPNKEIRFNYINKHQIYGLCISQQCVDSTKFILRMDDNCNSIIKCENLIYLVKEDKSKALEFIHKNFKEYTGYQKESEDTEEIMKFDVVIGNPPYNNDMYIPFVELGHNLSQKCSMFITPAKWQAKGGKLNESFRKNIVPYMSRIVYYPDTYDVFDIACQGGISIFSVEKTKHEDKHISSYCSKQHLIDTNGDIVVRDTKDIYNNTFLNDSVYSIIRKINISGIKLCCKKNEREKAWNVLFTDLYNEGKGQYLDCNGQAVVLTKVYYKYGSEKDAGASVFIDSFDEENRAKSMCSFLNSRTIRFCFLIGKCSMHSSNNACWRFVPDPGAFDHIFTDEELYKKYNLTEEEINIIESVIKERKQNL